MGRNIEEVLNSLPPERREKIERRSAELLTEYRTRQKLKEILETSEELGINEQLMMLQLMLRLLPNFNFGAELNLLHPEDLDNPIPQFNLTLSTSVLTGFSIIADISAKLHPEADKELRRLPNIIDEIVKARGEKSHSLTATATQKINLSVLRDLVEEVKGSLEVVVNLPGKSPVRLPIDNQEEMMSKTNVVTNTTPEPPVSHALSEFLPQFLQEIQQIPKEYWPNLLQIIRLFRESVNGENLAKNFTDMSEEDRIKRNQAVIELINSWVEEGDEQEQTETAEYLRQVLD